MTKSNLFLVFAFSGFGALLQAQPGAIDQSHLIAATAVNKLHTSSNPESRSEPVVADYYRHHKALPSTYTGFAIELATTQFPLKRNDVLFSQFGNIYIDKLPQGGFSYCILVDFSNHKALDQYVEQVIRRRAPQAKAVAYLSGKRR